MVSFKDRSAHILGRGTREFCLHRRASSSRALFSVVVTSSTDSPTHDMVVSSAYRKVVAVSTTFARSLIRRRVWAQVWSLVVYRVQHWYSQRVRH